MRRSYQLQGTPLDVELTNCFGPWLGEGGGTGTRHPGVEDAKSAVGLWDCRIRFGLRHGRRRTVASFKAIDRVLLRYIPMEDSRASSVARGSCDMSTTCKHYAHGDSVDVKASRTPAHAHKPRPVAVPRSYPGPQGLMKGHPTARPPRNPDCCTTCSKSRKYSTYGGH